MLFPIYRYGVADSLALKYNHLEISALEQSRLFIVDGCECCYLHPLSNDSLLNNIMEIQAEAKLTKDTTGKKMTQLIKYIFVYIKY